ncbi:hypothetical protein [Xanthomonas sp. 3058]|uniref:hypothetical protein n=1 Tax=Xanthomonas sp. 3058 TaxID=3035314 RepID=UPI00161B2B1E|nr:hypothetical protein [Xanthomonas sp. 3058]MBB5866347.1 hypothetical protein [Xanthomonas sp. 3058]
MQIWKRRVAGILAIGGGALGIVVISTVLVQQRKPLEWVFSLAFILLYAWGIWCGSRLLEGQPGAERSNAKFWLIQVPSFTSPVFSYFFSSGFHLTATLQFAPIETRVNFMLGSSFSYSLDEPSAAIAIGINVFALAMWLWLAHEARRMKHGRSTQVPVSGTQNGEG